MPKLLKLNIFLLLTHNVTSDIKVISKEMNMLYALLDDLRKEYDATKNTQVLESIRRVEKILQKGE